MVTENPKKSRLPWAFGLLFLGLVGVLVKQAFEETPEPSKPSFLSDLIILTARTTAQNRRIDEDTIFVRAQAANSHAIRFYYTLVNYDTHPDDFDLAATQSVITKAVCDSQMPRDQSIISLGGTVIYIFGSKNVKEIARFEVNKQSCVG